MLDDRRQREAIQILPLGMEMTTQQAAEFLNVSRPYLLRQLETGKIGYRIVSRHRRIALSDLIEYKKRRDAERELALEELARMTQELGEDEVTPSHTPA